MSYCRGKSIQFLELLEGNLRLRGLTNQLLYLLSYASLEHIGRDRHLPHKEGWDFREIVGGMQVGWGELFGGVVGLFDG
jgi:hypothetical protein